MQFKSIGLPAKQFYWTAYVEWQDSIYYYAQICEYDFLRPFKMLKGLKKSFHEVWREGVKVFSNLHPGYWILNCAVSILLKQVVNSMLRSSPDSRSWQHPSPPIFSLTILARAPQMNKAEKKKNRYLIQRSKVTAEQSKWNT